MELIQKIKQALPKNSIGRYDLLAVYKEAVLFAELVDYLCGQIKEPVEYIVSPEATGWPLAAAIAAKRKVGFVGIRKEGSLPYAEEDLLKTSFIDYTGKTKTFTVQKDFIPEKSNVIIVDDWIETGAQIAAILGLLAQRQIIVQKIVSIGADMHQNCVRQWKEKQLLLCVGEDI